MVKITPRSLTEGDAPKPHVCNLNSRFSQFDCAALWAQLSIWLPETKFLIFGSCANLVKYKVPLCVRPQFRRPRHYFD